MHHWLTRQKAMSKQAFDHAWKGSAPTAPPKAFASESSSKVRAEWRKEVDAIPGSKGIDYYAVDSLDDLLEFAEKSGASIDDRQIIDPNANAEYKRYVQQYAKTKAWYDEQYKKHLASFNVPMKNVDGETNTTHPFGVPAVNPYAPAGAQYIQYNEYQGAGAIDPPERSRNFWYLADKDGNPITEELDDWNGGKTAANTALDAFAHESKALELSNERGTTGTHNEQRALSESVEDLLRAGSAVLASGAHLGTAARAPVRLSASAPVPVLAPKQDQVHVNASAGPSAGPPIAGIACLGAGLLMLCVLGMKG